MSKIISFIISIIVIILLYVLVNFLLVGGQNLYKKDDVNKFETLKKEIKSEEIALKIKENELETMQVRINILKDSMNQIKTEVNVIESKYPSGVPSEIYSHYKYQVNNYNNKAREFNDILEKFNPIYEEYLDDLESTNSKINEANILSKEIGGTWYVIPIPGRVKSKKH